MNDSCDKSYTHFASDEPQSPYPKQIKQARLDAGLTQQAAADLVGVSIKSWQAYEGGWRNIRPATWRLFNLLTEGAK